ncbi:unnamed protein product [Leptidea sinapis]|uniref:Uncharacterized protein n=1 Tax=Leptidea sinapis TaxID=189913 RepID=A0A5E4PUX2_9NEOP|nr:unnamed protein product [Leptidea sinapis]
MILMKIVNSSIFKTLKSLRDSMRLHQNHQNNRR